MDDSRDQPAEGSRAHQSAQPPIHFHPQSQPSQQPYQQNQTQALAPPRVPLPTSVGHLDLPFVPGSNSLLDAVVGAPSSAPPAQVPINFAHTTTATPGSGRSDFAAAGAASSSGSGATAEAKRAPSDSAQSFGASTEREWDVLSDASIRLNEGELDEGEVVEELQKKVNKRRSNLPQLETQLAALNDKIRAAEEKLARAQNSPSGVA